VHDLQLHQFKVCSNGKGKVYSIIMHSYIKLMVLFCQQYRFFFE